MVSYEVSSYSHLHLAFSSLCTFTITEYHKEVSRHGIGVLLLFSHQGIVQSCLLQTTLKLAKQCVDR